LRSAAAAGTPSTPTTARRCGRLHAAAARIEA
jgi:hypothetical protein